MPELFCAIIIYWACTLILGLVSIWWNFCARLWTAPKNLRTKKGPSFVSLITWRIFLATRLLPKSSQSKKQWIKWFAWYFPDFPFLGLEKGLCVQGVVPEFSKHVHTMARTVRHACVFTKSFELAENMIRNSNHKKTQHKTKLSSVRKMLRDDKTKQRRNSFKNTYGISMRRDKWKNHLCFRFHHHHHHHHQFETKKIP